MQELIASVLGDKRLQTLLALIVLDVLMGVAAALKTGQFRWAEVGRFYSSTVVPVFVGYAALRATLPFIAAELLGPGGQWLTEGCATAFWLAGAATIVSSIARSVAILGVSLPE